jgi:hypothetical protein
MLNRHSFLVAVCSVCVVGILSVSALNAATITVNNAPTENIVVDVAPPALNASNALDAQNKQATASGTYDLYQSFTWTSTDALSNVTLYAGVSYVNDFTLSVVRLNAAGENPLTWDVAETLFTDSYTLPTGASITPLTTLTLDVGSIALTENGLYGLQVASTGNTVLAVNGNEDAYAGGVSMRDDGTLNNFSGDWGMELNAVPEPASLSLLMLGGVALLRRSRRS